MSDYSYTDMVKMQNEAKQRVLEMQKRSRDVLKSYNGERALAKEIKHEKPYSEDELPRVPKTISFPAELPTNSRQQPNNRGNLSNGRGLDLRAALNSVFGNLSEDEYEKMFILALCLLLAEEHEDDSLIFSLMYLLT